LAARDDNRERLAVHDLDDLKKAADEGCRDGAELVAAAGKGQDALCILFLCAVLLFAGLQLIIERVQLNRQ